MTIAGTELAAFLSVKDVAQLLGLSASATYELIYRRELPSHKIGRTRRVSRQDLEAFLASCRQAV